MSESLIVFGPWLPLACRLNQLKSTMPYMSSFEIIPAAIACIPPRSGVNITMINRKVIVPNTTPQATIFAPSHAVTSLSHTLL